MKKMIVVILVVASSISAACYNTKQCCKRDYKGNLECISKCDYEYCPYNYPIEIR